MNTETLGCSIAMSQTNQPVKTAFIRRELNNTWVGKSGGLPQHPDRPHTMEVVCAFDE